MARTYRKESYRQKDKENKLRRKLSNKKQRKNNKTKRIMNQYQIEQMEEQNLNKKGEV